MALALVLLVTWVPPVSNPVERVFAYDAERPFAAGQHRGQVYAAGGGAVHAPCSGRVATAQATAGRKTIALRCGPYRAVLLGIERIAVRKGQSVRAGDRVGYRRGALHLSIRNDADRFAYIDPATLIAQPLPRPLPPVALAKRTRPHPRPPRPPGAPVTPLAPWPAWLGLALLLAGAGTGGTRVRRARRARTRRETPARGTGRAAAPG